MNKDLNYMSKVVLYVSSIFVKKEIMSTKKIKNNLINLFVIAVFAITLVMVSCKTDANTSTENIDSEADVENVESNKDTTQLSVNADIENDEENTLESTENKTTSTNASTTDNELRTRTYRMNDGTAIVYDLDMNGIQGFKDWEDFNQVNLEFATIKRANYVTTQDRLQSMNFRVANLRNTIPAYLKTEEVMEDVADIQKEYLELISDADASEKEVRENLEELNEQFDDLKEELDETLKLYLEARKDAIEEYNEESKKGKIDEAIEEYNEEMKKYNKKLVKESE